MTEIPVEQMAMVVEQTGGPCVYKKIPVGKPGPDEVLINVKYSGVCRTDLHAMNGDWPIPPKIPLVGGHEGAGVVVARGELVENIQLGDHAGIKWLNGSCLSCMYCLAGDEPLCSSPDLSGYTVDGTFQQYAIAKASHIAHIPQDCDLKEVAPILCAGITVYKGLKESGAKPGQYVAVVGAGGGLGSLACQYAIAMGLRVIGVDSGAEKMALVEKVGGSFVDFVTSKDVIADIKSLTPDGLGVHAALLLAVQDKPYTQATQYVRPRGVVVCIGLPADAYIEAPVFDTVLRMVCIKGSYVGSRLDSAEAIEFYRQGLIKVPFRIIGLSKLNDVYDLMKGGKITGRYVLDTNG